MKEPVESGGPRGAAPTYKSKNAVQRSVTALLDELAPERVLRRIDALPGQIEQHRTPSGCVLQAANCAVSVSWFPEESKAGRLGELHVLVWSGIVARRGSTSAEERGGVGDGVRLATDRAPVGRLPVAGSRRHAIRHRVARGQVSRLAGGAGQARGVIVLSSIRAQRDADSQLSFNQRADERVRSRPRREG